MQIRNAYKKFEKTGKDTSHFLRFLQAQKPNSELYALANTPSLKKLLKGLQTKLSDFGNPPVNRKQQEKGHLLLGNSKVTDGGAENIVLSDTAKGYADNLLNQAFIQAQQRNISITAQSGESAVNFAEAELFIKRNSTQSLSLRKYEEAAHVGIR